MSKTSIGVGIFAVVLVVAAAMNDPEYTKFSAEREQWHQQCDVYRDVSFSDVDPDRLAAAKHCNQELKRLTAYATRKGWMK